MGMGLDYSPALDRHDARRKIGVITRAEIVGRLIEVGGFLYARDFPEIVKEIGRPQRREIRFRGWSAVGSTVDASHEGLACPTRLPMLWWKTSRPVCGCLNRVTFTGSGSVAAGQSGVLLDLDRVGIAFECERVLNKSTGTDVDVLRCR